MKKYFFTGLAILLPIVITLLIASFFLKLLTKPFAGLVEQILHGIEGPHHYLVTYPNLLNFISKLGILLLLFTFIVFIGVIGRHLLTTSLISLTDRFLHNIPIANRVYKGVKDVTHNLLTSNRPSFSQVVLVPFPNKSSQALGFITREGLPLTQVSKESDLISVFIPGTPNPTIGFMLMFPKSKLTFIDIKVEEAIKFIVSCGVILEKKQRTE